MRRRLGSFLIVMPIAMVAPLVVAPRTALAACHQFSVTVNPAYVREGGTVTVAVKRSGGGGQSSVRVSTIDETARAGEDYPAVNRVISFTVGQTERTLPLVIIDDWKHEPDESFRLHLSNPSSCGLESGHTGPDARVTIQDNDPAPAPTPAPAPPPTTRAPKRSRSTTTTTSTSRVAQASSNTTGAARRAYTADAARRTTTDDERETTDTTEARSMSGAPEITVPTLPPTTKPPGSEAALEVADENDGGRGLAIGVAVLSVLTVLGTGGYGLYRRRTLVAS